jgi:hypothetical protein
MLACQLLSCIIIIVVQFIIIVVQFIISLCSSLVQLCFICLFCSIQLSLFIGKIFNSDPGLYSRYFDPVINVKRVNKHHTSDLCWIL